LTFQAEDEHAELVIEPLKIYSRAFGDEKGKELSANLPIGVYRLYNRDEQLVAIYKEGRLLDGREEEALQKAA